MAIDNTTRFGLKEVADVKFYAYTGDAAAETPTYTFTSLKVSNLQVAAEQTSARGGKGNPQLIIWDYGKELTLSVEDALFSMDTLKLLMGAQDSDYASNTLTITPDHWTPYFKIVGDTVIRDENGVDHAFTFTIYKAKVNVGGTLTMQADGDPSTFSMDITAMRHNAGTAQAPSYKLIDFTVAE